MAYLASTFTNKSLQVFLGYSSLKFHYFMGESSAKFVLNMIADCHIIKAAQIVNK